MNVFAAEVSVEDLINGVVKIKGKTTAGSNVNVLVLNPGETPQTAENDSALQQYSDGITAGEDGTYSISIKLRDGYSGSFPVYIKEGNSPITNLSFYYATMNEKIKAADELINASNIKEKLSEVQNVLSLDVKIITDIDTTNVANELKESLEKNPIAFDLTKPKSDENVAAMMDLIGRIKTFALIESYNQGKKDAVYSSGEMLYSDITKLSEIDSNAYELAAAKLSEEGLNNVVSSMLNKKFASLEDLQKAFVDGVMFYGIKNNKEVGYGHISEYITNQNVKFAYGNTNSLSTYLSLSDSDKNKVNAIVKRNQNSLTQSNYISKINDYAKSLNNTPSSGGNPTGGSSSGGSSKTGSSQMYAPGAEQPNVNDNQNVNKGFTDIGGVEWAREAIEYLSDNKIISGVGEGIFAPNDKLTREQAAKIICEAFKIDIVEEEHGFSDVTAGSWYEKYVASAKFANVINGIDKNSFGVGKNITRQDIAVLLYRTIGETQEELKPSFTDSDDIADYAKTAVAYLAEKGMISGYQDGSFGPNKFITRAETATLIYNILKEE